MLSVVALMFSIYAWIENAVGPVRWVVVILATAVLAPEIARPLAWVWLRLAERLSRAGSYVVLSVVFFFIITPVGLWRRRFGDTLRRAGEWKQSSGSVFVVRNKPFSAADLLRPF